MSNPSRSLTLALSLGTLALAACQDTLLPPTDDSPAAPRPQFAQGDNGTWTVNSLADPGDGTCDDTECTFREAIDAAASGDKVVFSAGLQGEIQLTAGQLRIAQKDLSIDGAGRITVDAQNASRVLIVEGVVGTHDVSITGINIEDGTLTLGQDGAGILVNVGAHLRLENVTVAANTTDGNGGGIYVTSTSTVTFVNSTLKNNHAGRSGGGVAGTGGITVSGSTISGNTAGIAGGGLYGFNSINGGKSIITGSTISGNQADLAGGGISISESSVELRSTTITRNETKGTGGGLSVGKSSTSVTNSIITGNSALQGGENCGFDGFYSTQITSLGHNIYGSECPGTGGHFTDVRVNSNQAFTEVLDPVLKNNGGLTKTHALIARGRAVDAGYCPGDTTDQRGLGRPVDDPIMPNKLDACDIGAYELQGPFVPRADLFVSQSANKTSVKPGDLLTYTVRVRNLGPETAPNVVVTDVLPSGTTFVSATHAKGTHTAPPAGETGTVTWYLGSLLDQANETTEIKVTVRIKGKTTITNKATVTADVVDANTANNAASLTVSVGAGGTKPGR